MFFIFLHFLHHHNFHTFHQELFWWQLFEIFPQVHGAFFSKWDIQHMTVQEYFFCKVWIFPFCLQLNWWIQLLLIIPFLRIRLAEVEVGAALVHKNELCRNFKNDHISSVFKLFFHVKRNFVDENFWWNIYGNIILTKIIIMKN